jgi:hypothetical protein
MLINTVDYLPINHNAATYTLDAATWEPRRNRERSSTEHMRGAMGSLCSLRELNLNCKETL